MASSSASIKGMIQKLIGWLRSLLTKTAPTPDPVPTPIPEPTPIPDKPPEPIPVPAPLPDPIPEPVQSPVVPPFTTGTATAITLSGFGHFGNNKPFLNLLKSAQRGWQSSTGANGWDEYVYTDRKTEALVGMPAGSWFRKIVHVRDDEGYTYLRTGTYHLFWEGDSSCTLDGYGALNPRLIGANHFAVDITDTNPAINLSVTNNTIMPIDFRVAAIVHADDLLDYQAGKVFQKDWLAALSGAKVLRIMDWTNTPVAALDPYGKDTLITIDPENFMTQDSLIYSAPEISKDLFLPPEITGLLGVVSGASFMMSLPTKLSDAGLDYFISKFAEGAGPDWKGNIIVEPGDELWNRAWPWGVSANRAVARIAPTIKVVDQNGSPSDWFVDQQGCVAAHLGIKWANAWIAKFGKNRVSLMLCGQFMAGQGNSGMGGMFSYVDPITGKTAKELADLYGVAPYWGAGDGSLTAQGLIDTKAWEFPDQWWIDQAKICIDKEQQALALNQEMLKQQAPNLKLSCYEGGGFFVPETVQQVTRDDNAKLLEKRCRELMDGIAGEIVTAYYWDTFIKGNFTLYNHFNSHGYFFGNQYALCDSQFKPQTPRMKLFRTLSA